MCKSNTNIFKPPPPPPNETKEIGIVVENSFKNRGNESTGCFKKSFTTLKAYVNLFRGHVQYFELS
jgi:hypothetical protein